MANPTQLLRELIALPSVNPAFLPAGHAHAGEHLVAAFLTATAARLGLAVELQEVFPNRPNLLARLLPSGRVQQRVVLAPHMDTVGVTSDAQFKPVVKNGKIHGRGACDTKGCVAAMLTAVALVAEKKKRPQHTEIVFAGLIDEENGQCGSHALADSGFTADLAIVGEPTRLKVVTAHKGDLWLRFETRGRAAHGAEPHRGKNAVHEMARVVDVLETEYAAQLRKRKHALLGSGTINVGAMRGGVQANIVPDRCEMIADRRTLPGETEAGVRREIGALLRRHGLRATLADSRDNPCFALETNPKLPLVQRLMAVAGQRAPEGVNYFCDASVLAAGGTPSVVFGPGDIAQAHTADEWISVRELERGTRMLAEFLLSLP
ncbi:MAG: M20/M25/M40 family metallo-hydrolase [Verrucomicrobia bacterium]|nr:M20/M25/M40 family metallo-hydrolase [Verrucomicrobiota bacterium]